MTLARASRTAPHRLVNTSVFGVADDVVSRIGVPSWSGTGVQDNLSLDRGKSLVITVTDLR